MVIAIADLCSFSNCCIEFCIVFVAVGVTEEALKKLLNISSPLFIRFSAGDKLSKFNRSVVILAFCC